MSFLKEFKMLLNKEFRDGFVKEVKNDIKELIKSKEARKKLIKFLTTKEVIGNFAITFCMACIHATILAFIARCL